VNAKEAGPNPASFILRDALSPRRCERSKAIQNFSAEGFWIASSQELLAMTAWKHSVQNNGNHARPTMIRAIKSSFTIRVDFLFTASRDHAFTNVRDRPVKTPVFA
jgi:hypothetical protein